MDKPAEKRARRQHDRTGAKDPAIGELDAIGAIANEEVVNLTLNDREVFRQPQRLLHSRRVQLPISLGARTPDGRALAAIEQTKLDATGIGDAAHQAIQRVDLAHQVPFAEPSDRRVA